MSIVLVAAVAENGVIGRDGEMPWHYPEDLKHFRETTLNEAVLMGRRTYESIVAQLGHPLDQRLNIVLSTTMEEPENENVRVYDSLDEALAGFERSERTDLYVVGGGTVYEQTLPHASKMVLTQIADAPGGDTYFPEWDTSDWEETEHRNSGDLSFVTYQRRE